MFTPTRDRLQGIIEKFRDITGVPNICGAIDGTHIPLSTRLDARITTISIDFFNRKKFHSKQFVIQIRYFGMCTLDN